MTRECKDCFHSVTWDATRCTRPQRLPDGKIRTMQGGFSAIFERDGYDEEWRAKGDKCGKEGKHWMAKE